MIYVAWCHYHLQELFGEEGVDVLVSYLKLDLSLLTSGLGHQLLLITAIDCVWSVMSLAHVPWATAYWSQGVFCCPLHALFKQEFHLNKHDYDILNFFTFKV